MRALTLTFSSTQDFDGKGPAQLQGDPVDLRAATATYPRSESCRRPPSAAASCQGQKISADCRPRSSEEASPDGRERRLDLVAEEEVADHDNQDDGLGAQTCIAGTACILLSAFSTTAFAGADINSESTRRASAAPSVGCLSAQSQGTPAPASSCATSATLCGSVCLSDS